MNYVPTNSPKHRPRAAPANSEPFHSPCGAVAPVAVAVEETDTVEEGLGCTGATKLTLR